VNKIIGVFLFGLLAAGSALAQSQPYSTYGGAADWIKAVADAGITPEIGTQTFEGIQPALYPFFNDVGNVGYSSQESSQVSVALLSDGGHVLRPLDTAEIYGVGLRAIAFDFSIEARYPGCGGTDATVLIFRGGNSISIEHVHTGFFGIIAPPEIQFDRVEIRSGGICPGVDIVLVDNVSYPGGPNSSPTNPNPPRPCPPGIPSGAFCFTPPVAIGPAWYDPPATNAFDFSSPDAKFISINDFPTGFASPFTVSTGGVVLGSFTPGQTVQFPNGGVNEFRISDISPTVDGANPYSFPINLSLDKVGVVFTMTPASASTPTPSPTPTPTPSDSTAPTLSLPANSTAEACGPAGAVVTYSASATDDTDSHPSVVCSPASGSTFAIGTTAVHCTATDASGNSAGGSFNVAVVDTTPPALTVPTNITADGTSAQGAAISFTASANDIVDPHPTVSCVPISGSAFALGTTSVQCTATDSAGNTAHKSFNVTVTYPWSGVLQPINPDGSSIFKLGSTVPVKFQLSGASAGIQNAIAHLFIAKISDGLTGNELEASSTAAATSGNQFRYDASICQYIFNWGTKGLSTGAGTYQLRIDLGDGVLRVVNVSLKQ
jgi:hypothetical protein